MLLLITAGHAQAQSENLENRPVSQVLIEGLQQVSEQLVRNQIRLDPGEPYSADVVAQDIVRITHLGRFSSVVAEVAPNEDGTVTLIYRVSERNLLADVQVVGNKAVSDQELLNLVILQSGDPIDPFLIERAQNEIERAYEQRGYFTASVSIDQDVLDESGVLVFRVREGPRVRIEDIQFEGNKVFSDKELQSRIRSKEYIPIFRRGDLNREMLDNDVAEVRKYYQNHGYLDAQVGRRIDLAEDQSNAVVVFLVDEGAQYTVEQLRVEGNTVFPDEQIRQTIELREGDVFSAEKVRETVTALRDAYGRLGYLDTNIEVTRTFQERAAKVDVGISIDEGNSYTVGKVTVRGNQVTRDKVVLRELRGMEPGRKFDRTGLDRTEVRLRESALFSNADITLLGDPEDEVRDVLVEVKERNTGSISFGAGISSDAGLLGAIDVRQRNFDIADFPESAGELFTGRAFRGAGQFFNLSLQPGAERSLYAVSFREPYLLESDFFFDARVSYFERIRTDYDEERLSGALGIGKRFGDVWSISLNTRYELVDISDVDDDAPVDVYAVEDDTDLYSVGISAVRSTYDSALFPTRGSKFEFSLSRVQGDAEDYNFGFFRTLAEYKQFWTVDEDFFGRKTVVSLRTEVGHIFDTDSVDVTNSDLGRTATVSDVPVFERFYAGGHSSFRGFDYRGVGPRGIEFNTFEKGDEGVGGEWLFLLGLEYNYPIYQDTLRGVFFVDTGTLSEDVEFDNYRVSVGAGIRLKIPFLAQAPFALDLAVPVVKDSDDETRLISFAFSLPFQ